MNLKFKNLLFNVKTRLYDDLSNHWQKQYTHYKNTRLVFLTTLIVSAPLAYLSLIYSHNMLLFLIPALLSIISGIVLPVHFFSLEGFIPCKETIKNNFNQQELFEFSEKNLLHYFNIDGYKSNMVEDFNSQLSKEELQQLMDVGFNDQQLNYLYELLKSKKSVQLHHLLALEKLQEKSIESYHDVFNKFANDNQLNSNILNRNVEKSDLKTVEATETYYEKYL